MGTSYNDIGMHAYIGDHPHAYGDKCVQSCCHKAVIGSSPRVWGQVQCTAFNGRCNRIIPTRMGTRLLWCNRCFLHRDHPHAYGDKPESAPPDWRDKGSSPRVWGQADLTQYLAVSQRIIPTRMGTRSKMIVHLPRV